MAAVGAAGEEADELQNDQYKDTSVHAQRATEAFESPEFWAMVALLRVFAGWIAGLMHWCLGCPCHSHRFREYFHMHLEDLDCPLRTCLAPDIAAGALD